MKNTKSLFFISLFCFLTINTWGRSRTDNLLRDSLVNYSKKYIGCKYKYASKGPKTFDCSGFTSYVFSHFGYSLSSSSSSQYTQGDKIKKGRTKKGDLIFFKGSNAKSKSVGHVGIVVDHKGNSDTVYFIHASVQKGVTIDLYPGLDYYNKRFIGYRRIIGEEESSDEFIPDPKEETDKKDVEPTPKRDDKSTPSADTLQKKTEKDEVVTDKETNEKGESNIVHIVQKGDNLYRISKQYGCKVDDIIKWNKLKNNNLKIGQKLLINPDADSPQSNEEKEVIDNHSKDEKEEITPAPSDTTDVKKESSDQEKSVDKDEKPKEDNGNSNEKSEEVTTHIVKKGETLYRIGKQYGCTAEEIMKWNQMKNANLRIGQQLIIKR